MGVFHYHTLSKITAWIGSWLINTSFEINDTNGVRNIDFRIVRKSLHLLLHLWTVNKLPL